MKSWWHQKEMSKSIHHHHHQPFPHLHTMSLKRKFPLVLKFLWWLCTVGKREEFWRIFETLIFFPRLFSNIEKLGKNSMFDTCINLVLQNDLLLVHLCFLLILHLQVFLLVFSCFSFLLSSRKDSPPHTVEDRCGKSCFADLNPFCPPPFLLFGQRRL